MTNKQYKEIDPTEAKDPAEEVTLAQSDWDALIELLRGYGDDPEPDIWRDLETEELAEVYAEFIENARRFKFTQPIKTSVTESTGDAGSEITQGTDHE